jgi:hypothetical protein
MCFINGNVLDGLVEGSILANSSSEACEVTLMWHELFGGSDEYPAVLVGLLLKAVRQVH